MKISQLIEELEHYQQAFGDIEVRRCDYDECDDVYSLCHPTTWVSELKDLQTDQYILIDPDDLGERIVEIG